MATKLVTAEDEGLALAIAETEQEIFSEANGNEPLENNGDKSLEEMGDDLEGRTNEDIEPDEEAELEAKDDETEGEEAEQEEAPVRAESDPRIPPGRLREEADKRRAAETEAATLREQMAELRGRLDQFTRTQPQQEQRKPDVPDMFSDPEGWQRHLVSQLTQTFEQRQIASSFQDAADSAPEKFKSASDELNRIGAREHAQFGASPTVKKIWSSANPGKALISWHEEQSLLREIGGDLKGYQEKVKDQLLNDPDFVATVIKHARGEATNGRRARTIPSLNGASGRSHTETDPDLHNNSEGAVFDFATR